MRVKVRGFEMAYDDTGGAGMPLLLIHGFPLDRTLWAPQTRGLADVARVIAPDLRGFGESGMPAGAVTMETYANDLRALLDALGIKHAVIGGLSMGGYIALAFYRQYAPRVRALILANTRASADSPEGKQARDESAALAHAQGATAIAAKMLPKMLAPQTIAARSDVVAAARAMMERQSVAGSVAALAAMRDRPDSTPTLAAIAVPTLILTGAEETVIAPQEVQTMREAIHGARLITIAGAAHLSNFEQPDAFNRAVREFLKTIGALNLSVDGIPLRRDRRSG